VKVKLFVKSNKYDDVLEKFDKYRFECYNAIGNEVEAYRFSPCTSGFRVYINGEIGLLLMLRIGLCLSLF